MAVLCMTVVWGWWEAAVWVDNDNLFISTSLGAAVTEAGKEAPKRQVQFRFGFGWLEFQFQWFSWLG